MRLIADSVKCQGDNKTGSCDSDRGRLLYIKVVEDGHSEEVTFKLSRE